MNDSEVHYTTAGLMRKSVENLLISSHDVIGSSISPSLTFGAMTLPTNCPQGHIANSLEIRSPSPSGSPQSSPRPSPQQHHRRDHSKGEIPVGSCKEYSPLDKSDILEDSLSRSSDSSHIHELHRSTSHDGPSRERTKESARGPDRSKKKSSWYNVLYPTYKSRSEDFKRIFKDVPPEERLIVDYSCALQKDILVHGRLYASQHYLCFYANIFRWETLVSLRWKDVTAITKEKTALVIPNAILVCTEGEKLFFTSFGARDKTYLMLFRVWQNALLDQQLSMQEMWQWVHRCYGDELGLTSDDEDYIPPASEEDKPSNMSSLRLSVESFSEENDTSMDSSDEDEMNSQTRTREEETLNRVGTEEKPWNRTQEYDAGEEPDQNKINETLDNERNEIGSVKEGPSNNHRQSNKKEVIVQHKKRHGIKAMKAHMLKNKNAEQAQEQEGHSMTESHTDATNTEEHQEHQNDTLSFAVTTGISMHSTSYTSTTLHSTSNRDSAGHDQRSETLPTDMSDTTESDAEKQAEAGAPKSSVCTSLHDGRRVIRCIIPIHIDLLFTMLFTNSKFFLDFHSVRRTTDISHTPWQQDPQTGTKQRVVNYTIPLSQSLGPKTSQVTETQIMLPCSKPGELYAIDAHSVNGGIPYADSFYVSAHHCLSRTSDTETCLAIYAQVKYKKYILGLVKSFIEKNTWTGLEDFYSHLQRSLLEEGTHLPVAKKKTRRRRRLLSVCSNGSEEPKHRISRPVSRFPLPELCSAVDSVSWVVLAVLLFLVLLNALLYYKLWVLEQWAQDSSQTYSLVDLQVLRHPPKSHEEWLHVLQQQETIHNVEMQKWQKVLQAAVQLLRQTEESLSELQVAINPIVSKKMMSALKDTFPEESATPQPEVDQSNVSDLEGEL